MLLEFDMDISCTEKELVVFRKIASAATELGMPCYLIGGFVRDKLLGRTTKDVDIVCVGDGIRLANAVAGLFRPRPPVSFFKTFGTAQIKIDDLEIEFVGGRTGQLRFHVIEKRLRNRVVFYCKQTRPMRRQASGRAKDLRILTNSIKANQATHTTAGNEGVPLQ